MIKLPKLSYRYYLNQIPNPVRKTGQKWAPTVAAIFLITFFIIFAIKPTVVTIAELVAEIEARKELNGKLNSKINQILAAQALYSQVYDQLYLLNQALPANPEFAYFSQTLEGERVGAELNLKTLNYSSIILTEKESEKNTDQQDNQELTFAASLSGSYPSLRSFLENIVNQRRIIYIDNLKVSQTLSEQGEKKNQPLVISLSGKSFYLETEQ